MKVMAVNGSPRKRWNAATMLRNDLKVATSQGAETELIHLCDLKLADVGASLPVKLERAKAMAVVPSRMVWRPF